MAKRIIVDSPNEKLPSKLNTTWTAIIAGCTLLSMGFGAGFYISNVLSKIEINEIKQAHNQKLYDQKKDFDSKVEELVHEKHLLEIENGKLSRK